jgi:hypothetical protein
MALMAVEGFYKNGKVVLAETPPGVKEARVMVVFLPVEAELKAETPATDAAAARRAAGDRLLARLKKGYHLGGGRPYEKREYLYDRLERHRGRSATDAG